MIPQGLPQEQPKSMVRFNTEDIQFFKQFFPMRADGLTDTIVFYAASTSGGSPTVKNTVTVKGGQITSWTQK